MFELSKYVNKNDRLVLAVSGGIDSVVLLDVISKDHPNKNLIISHVNHGIRKESRKDEEFVRDLAKKYDIDYRSITLNLKKYDENNARKARYEFLRKIKAEFRAKYIVTAHHMDDQLETILLNLIRGTGPLKMWGMSEVSGDILRPMLSVSKDNINKYAKDNNLKWVEDKTNKDITYARNRIRHNIIPEIKKINKNVLKNINTSGMLASELSDFINSEVNKFISGDLSVSRLKNAHPFIAKEAIKQKMHEMIGKNSDVYSKNVNAVYGILEKKGYKKTEIAGMVIEKDRDTLYFNKPHNNLPKIVDLIIDEEIVFNGFKLILSNKRTEPSKNNILLSRDFEYNLRVRNWEEGDKIKTTSGTKNLSDVFTNAKISQHERKKWPIVISGEEIIWVPKLTASNNALSCYKKDCLIIEVK